ncbi:hypothetical protein ACXYN8_00570 [Altererythrobacter sp. CAU 1778]
MLPLPFRLCRSPLARKAPRTPLKLPLIRPWPTPLQTLTPLAKPLKALLSKPAKPLTLLLLTLLLQPTKLLLKSKLTSKTKPKQKLRLTDLRFRETTKRAVPSGAALFVCPEKTKLGQRSARHQRQFAEPTVPGRE